MDNKLKYLIDEESAGIELREFLKQRLNFSSRFVRNAIREGRININNKKTFLSSVIKVGDCVEITLNKEESQNIEPQKMDISVAYEDNDIIVVNKPPGIVVHPTKRYTDNTLANGLLYYFKETGQNCIVRLVSRLDMDTSGLIIIAKNQFSHSMLAKEMEGDSFEKSYLAVIHGHMDEKEGTIDLPIFRPGEGSIERIVDERGQHSITHYKVLQSFKEGEIVKLTLETGRTHQIRVHLSHIGHPIYGDALYCKFDDKELIGRQALHAYRLVFRHPTSGKTVSIETELPEDMKALAEKLSGMV